MMNNSKKDTTNNNQQEFHKYRIEYESNMRKLRFLNSRINTNHPNTIDYKIDNQIENEMEKRCLEAELASLKDCIASLVIKHKN